MDSRDAALSILEGIPGLSAAYRFILQDCYGSIANIAQASYQDILSRTPTSKEGAAAVSRFFSEQEEE